MEETLIKDSVVAKQKCVELSFKLTSFSSLLFAENVDSPLINLIDIKAPFLYVKLNELTSVESPK